MEENMKLRKLTTVIITMTMSVMTMFTGCKSGADEITKASDITVISREEGSGTRGAFVELMGVVDEEDRDITVGTAEITQSTAVMLTTVKDNVTAIGYVSLGSLSDDVKTVKVDGVEPTVANVENGTYKVSRPFNIAYKEDSLSDVAKDFIRFIMSVEGQEIVADEGYISIGATNNYVTSDLSGKVILAGSTSVAPVMNKIAEAYMELNKEIDIEIQEGGSSAGMTSAINDACDIGMASREVKDTEIAEGLTSQTMALDGIAVIVNKSNIFADALTSEQIKKIYLGEITKWSLE